MANEQWFSHIYRRNLVDMHIEDWDEQFLSQFEPEEYLANLKKAHIQSPMLYLQSHVGHCYWPTQTGHMHRAFVGCEDKMKRLAQLCKNEGMHPVGYYSLIYNTYEEDNHPEWRLFGYDGKSAHQRGGRYGLCCPNNPEYRAFVAAQIREMAEYFVDEDGNSLLDGMFYDMTFWPDVCHCDHCKARFQEVTGLTELPAVNWNDPTWLTFQHLREQWMGEFARFATEETKRLLPYASVEHNYANAVASDSSLLATTELINDWCDYTGGDLYGDLYNHSFTAKYYYAVTKNQPFEYMTCRCDKALGVHTISKSDEHLAVEVLLTAAHHGASLVIDAIDPVGTLDSRVYDRIGRVFEKQIPYEPYFRGDMVQDVAVYYSTSGRFNTKGLPVTSKTASIALTRTLIEEHVPVGIVANSITNRLPKYKMVFAPHIAGLSDQNRADLLAYVKNGGTLYFSGAEDPTLVSLFFGAKVKGYTAENAVYMAPTEAGQPYFGDFTQKYPFPTEQSLPILTGSDAEVLATMTLPYTKPSEKRFASIHSNPPGVASDMPALLRKKIGKGVVIWSSASFENDGRRSHKKLLMALVNDHLPDRTITTTAPRQVEIVTFRDSAETLVSTVDLLCTDELLPVPSFTISVHCDKEPTTVTRLAHANGADEAIDFTWDNDSKTARFAVDGLVMFDMFKIQ